MVMTYTAKAVLFLVFLGLPVAHGARKRVAHSQISQASADSRWFFGENGERILPFELFPQAKAKATCPLNYCPLDAPFDVHFTVKNKMDVVKNKFKEWFGLGWESGYAVGHALGSPFNDGAFSDKVADKFVASLPEKLKEAGLTVSMQKQKAEDLTIGLTMQIQDYDPALWDFEFSDHVTALKAVLQDLGVENNVAPVKYVTDGPLRKTLMERMPELLKMKIAEFSVECDTPLIHDSSLSDAEPVLPAVTPTRPPPRKLQYRLTVSDGEQEGNFTDATRRVIGSASFWSMFMAKLEKKMPVKLGVKLGGSVKAVSTTAYADEDATNGGKKAFWFIVEVDAVEAEKTLPFISEPAFAEKYEALLTEVSWFHTQDADEIRAKMWDTIQNDLLAEIFAIAMADLQAKLPGQLTDVLGANVQLMSEDIFTEVKQKAFMGRCCGTGAEGDGQFFFVSKDKLDYSDFSDKGRCPAINTESACKEKEGELTHVHTTMDCFEVAGQELKQTATSVQDICPEPLSEEEPAPESVSEPAEEGAKEDAEEEAEEEEEDSGAAAL